MKIKLNALDKMFSKLIRVRDKWTCQRCFRYYPVEHKQGLHCSHYHGRRKKSVRYDPENACALCFGCHQYFHENPEKHKQFMLDRLGENRFNILQIRAETPGKPDYKLLKLWLKHELKRIETKYELNLR